MKILKKDMVGKEVIFLTDKLNDFGYEVETTDIFDNNVENAVKSFQARHIDKHGNHLTIDGEVGPVTWWALNNAVYTAFERQIPEEFFDVDDFSVGNDQSKIGLQAVKVAMLEIENGAKEEGENNSGKFVKKYLNNIINPPANWCAAFVSYCYKRASDNMGINKMPFNYSLGARDVFGQFAEVGEVFYPGEQYNPMPGDIVCFWRGSVNSWMGHIGLLHHYCDESGFYYVIEGNKGAFPALVNIFDYKQKHINKLIGFGRITI